MAVWFSPNQRTEFSNVVTIFWDSFRAEFVDCFMAEFISVNDNPESCKKKNNNNKTKAKISRPSPDYFQGRVWLDLWPGMASLCKIFLCVIVGNFITC